MLQEADPVWGEAQAELQQAVKGKPGGNGSNQHTKSNPPHRGGLLPDPTLGANHQPTDRKSKETATHRVAVIDPTLGTGRQPTDLGRSSSRAARGSEKQAWQANEDKGRKPGAVCRE